MPRTTSLLAGLAMLLAVSLVGCQPTAQKPAELKELKVSIVGASFVEVGPPQAPAPAGQVKLTFKVENPNNVEVKLQHIQYTLRGRVGPNDLPIPVSPSPAQLLVTDARVPANGSITVYDTVTIAKAGPFVPIWPQIQKVDKWSAAGVALVVKEGFAQPFNISQ